MNNYDFHDWCKLAVEQIRYIPDRQSVYAELKAHMEDRYDTYRELGLTDAEATQRTLAAMGDAKVIAPQLAQIHKPFWGYAYSFCRSIFKLLIVIVASLCVGFLIDSLDDLFSRDYGESVWKPYKQVTFEDEEKLCTRLDLISPDISHTDSGYRITLTDATRWIADWKNPNQADSEFFYFRLTIHAWPWAELPTFGEWIWAEDSLGNYYYSDRETLHFYTLSEPHVESQTSKTGPFSYSCTMRIQEYKAKDVNEIEWIDLHYDRGGRDMVFRVEFGGEEDA